MMNNNFNLLLHGYTKCPRDWEVRRQSATFYRMYYVYGGEAYVKINDEVIPFEKGHFYILPLMNPYNCWNNPEDTLDVLWFHVEMDTELYSDFKKIKIKEGTILYTLLQSMKYLINTANYYSELTSLLDIFLTVLNDSFLIKSVKSRRMRKLLEYVEENICNDISVQKMADYVGMERSYFSRRFKDAFHLSPSEYITSVRMSKASRAIIDGYSIYESGCIGGYTDEKAFSRAFRKYNGFPPSEYKRRHI